MILNSNPLKHGDIIISIMSPCLKSTMIGCLGNSAQDKVLLFNNYKHKHTLSKKYFENIEELTNQSIDKKLETHSPWFSHSK